VSDELDARIDMVETLSLHPSLDPLEANLRQIGYELAKANPTMRLHMLLHNAPETLQVALYTDQSEEVSGAGYERQAFDKTITFTAQEPWGTIESIELHADGISLARIQLNASRQIVAGDTLKIDLNLVL
jgi:hypothetical protein